MLNNAIETPFFSIIIPTYNRASLILKTLESVNKQEFRDFEIIVVDDGSTDNTEELVARLNNPQLFYFKRPNLERGAARNYGIEKAKGNYITFCDSDDIIYPDYLSNALETINKNNQPDWMHLAYEIKRNDGQSIKIDQLRKHFIDKLAKGNPLSCMGVFVKREIFELYRFQENRHMAGSEDWELWLRLAARYPIVFDNRISAALLVHDHRSVVQTNELRLQMRKYLSLGYAFDDEFVRKRFGPKWKMMNAYFDTYIALHLMLSEKKGSLKYFLKAIYQYPLVIFNRRALAILKYLVLTVVKR